MLPVVSTRVMRESDAETIKGGVPARELMRRAGKAIYEAALKHYGKKPRSAAILCGTGNNAGDGYVFALWAASHGIPVTLYLLEDAFSPDGKAYFDECVSSGIPYVYIHDVPDFSGFDMLIDCLYGTGFRGELPEKAASIVRAANESGAYIVSADINSGLGGDSGRSPLCIHSSLTVAVQYLKYGMLLGCAKDVIKAWETADIGISLHGHAAYRPDEGDFADLFPPRPFDCHKGSFGYVAIMGGSSRYSGAAKLANLAASAMRAGCGVIKLAVPASLCPSVSPYLLESTLFPLKEDENGALYDPDGLDELTRGVKALSVGMGWGKSGEYIKILRYLLTHFSGRLLLDADALNALSEDISLLEEHTCPVVLTPHPLEFSRLSGKPIGDVLDDPVRHAEDFAAKYRVVLLLKGTSTVVTDGSETYIVDRGCAGMATAGSGDVLSGVLTGLLGWNEPSPRTVACGAYLAGLAGEYAQTDVGDTAMIASDTVSHLPQAIKTLSQR